MRKYTINDKEFNVSVNSVTGDKAEVMVNGVTYQVKIENAVSDIIPSAAIVETAVPAPAATEAHVQAAEVSGGTGRPVKSPLPGVIVGVKVKVGESVKEGQVVAVLEAMKMENEIQSEFRGTVISINVNEGDSILEGAPIVTIA